MLDVIQPTKVLLCTVMHYPDSTLARAEQVRAKPFYLPALGAPA